MERLRRELAKGQRGSATARWAAYVLQACLAEDDLKTLSAWAKLLGVSYTSLRESCYMLGIHPHEARDFARVLRSLIRSSSTEWEPARFLDIADRRTAIALLEKAGLNQPAAGRSPLQQFFETQSFIQQTNLGVLCVMEIVKRLARPE